MNAQNPIVPVTIEASTPLAVSRRRAIQWVMAAAAASTLPATLVSGRIDTSLSAPGGGYGKDPNLVQFHHPGDFWPLTFTTTQRKTATALADTIIPEDQYGPAASQVGVVAMLDEWVSAPYPEQLADRPVVLEGLAWTEVESEKRFGKAFSQLSQQHRHAICDDICFTEAAKPEFRKPSEFFSRFRTLCASAYYATPEGWNAIGYLGNVPLAQFDGPPQEVLDRLEVTQTVK